MAGDRSEWKGSGAAVSSLCGNGYGEDHTKRSVQPFGEHAEKGMAVEPRAGSSRMVFYGATGLSAAEKQEHGKESVLCKKYADTENAGALQPVQCKAGM